MKNKKMKRILSIPLCILLVYQFGTTQVFAAENIINNDQATCEADSSYLAEADDESLTDLADVPDKETDQEVPDKIQHIDISGITQIETDKVTSDLPSIQARGIGVSGGSHVTGVGKITYDFLNTSLDGHTSLNGSVDIEISSIEYRLKMDVGLFETRIDDLYLNVDSKVSMSAGLAMGLQETGEAGELKLGSVPFRMGNSQLSGELIFWLIYDAYGNASISYNLESSTGVEYLNGELHPFANNHSNLNADANSEFTLGPKIQVVLYYNNDALLFDVTLDSGISGTANASMDLENGHYHLDCFVYLNMYTGEDSMIGQLLHLKKNVIWDYNTSPFHIILES